MCILIWDSTPVYRPLSYPFRSLIAYLFREDQDDALKRSTTFFPPNIYYTTDYTKYGGKELINPPLAYTCTPDLAYLILNPFMGINKLRTLFHLHKRLTRGSDKCYSRLLNNKMQREIIQFVTLMIIKY